MANVGGLQAAADERKARLLALRQQKRQADESAQQESAKRQRLDEDGDEIDEDERGENAPAIKFRNYTPISETLQENALPKPGIVSLDDAVKEDAKPTKQEEVDLINLQPRKPNWDLKRDVAKKLDVLGKKTTRAIAELIRERLKGEGDLATAVAATGAVDNDNNSDDD
eukprot:Opistho-2@4819